MIRIAPQYIKPESIDEMWGKLPQDKKIFYLAGGTDLMNCLRDGVIDAEKSLFVDISALKELNGIVEKDNSIRIGAAVTFADLLRNNLALKWAPALVSAARTMGTPQIANRATIGGNIAFASPAGDSLPALVAHGASVEVASAGGRRTAEITSLFLGPKKTNLANGEIITAIIIPAQAREGFEIRGAFKKFGGRKAHIISKVSAAITAAAGKETLENIRVAVGSLGPTVICVKYFPKTVSFKNVNSEEFQEKLRVETAKAISPIDDFRSTADYRKQVIAPLLNQILAEITGSPVL